LKPEQLLLSEPIDGALCDAVALESSGPSRSLNSCSNPPDEGGDKKKKKGLDLSDDLRYQIVIDCQSESQQSQCLTVRGEGIKCRPLIS